MCKYIVWFSTYNTYIDGICMTEPEDGTQSTYNMYISGDKFYIYYSA